MPYVHPADIFAGIVLTFGLVVMVYTLLAIPAAMRLDCVRSALNSGDHVTFEQLDACYPNESGFRLN